MRTRKVLYVASWVLFLFSQTFGFDTWSTFFSLFFNFCVICFGLMTYSLSSAGWTERSLFVFSFVSVEVYAIYFSFIDFLSGPAVEFFLLIAGLFQLFFFFRITSIKRNQID